MRTVSLVVIVFLLLFNCPLACGLELNGKAALLMDPYSGRMFFEQNSAERLPVASLSKLMTLVLILEALEREEVSLGDLITASPFAASKRGTRIWLEAGEQLPLGELIYAIAVGSANDAAVAVAEFMAGTEAGFVQAMNARAQELGLTATVFSNCSGLPEEGKEANRMSAQDIARLAIHALSVPKLLDYVSTYEYTMRAESTGIPVLWNANRLLRRYYGVDGLKTGFTSEAGYCLAVTAQRDQLRLIAVTLGNETEAERENDARVLLDYGFRKYQSIALYPSGAVVGSLQCPSGEPKEVDVVLPNDFQVTVERGKEVDLTTVISLQSELQVPLVQGAVVGTISAFYQDQLVGTNSVTVAKTVQKARIPALILRFSQALAQALF